MQETWRGRRRAVARRACRVIGRMSRRAFTVMDDWRTRGRWDRAFRSWLDIVDVAFKPLPGNVMTDMGLTNIFASFSILEDLRFISQSVKYTEFILSFKMFLTRRLLPSLSIKYCQKVSCAALNIANIPRPCYQNALDIRTPSQSLFRFPCQTMLNPTAPPSKPPPHPSPTPSSASNPPHPPSQH